MKRAQGKRRGLLFAGAIVAAVTLLYGALALANICTPKITCAGGEADLGQEEVPMSLLAGEWLCYPGALMPDELEGKAGQMVDAMRIGAMEGNTYRVMLAGQALDELCFSLPRSRGSQVWIDGQAVAAGDVISTKDVFAFADYMDSTQEAHELLLRIPVSGYFYSGYQGVAIGARDDLEAMDSVRYFVEVFCLGLYMTLGLMCLVLFLQKTTEGYILYLVVFTLVTAYRFMNYSEHFSSYPVFRIGSDFFRLFFFMRFTLCRAFVAPKRAGKREAADWAVASMTVLGGIFYLFIPGRFASVSADINLLALGLEGLLIGRGLLEGRQGVRILLVGWGMYAGMEIFYRLLHVGVIEQGIVDVLIRPTQYAHMAYLIAFAAAVLGKFACKFSEAEEMAVSLEQKVLEQTQELREKNQRIVEEQNQRQQFLTDIVHNLRNPLFALGGYMELLQSRMREPGGEEKKYLGLIEDKLVYLNRMVDDMLLFNRLENGKIQFHFVRMDLGAFLRSAAESNKLLEACEAVEIACPQLMVEADGFRLHQAIDNLLDNAVIHGGCTRIKISAREENGRVLLDICDNGRGMTPEQLSFAFDRYYTSGQKNSTGLGLSIAAAIIKEHGGEIMLSSQPGQGTVVRIALPTCFLPPFALY